MDRDESQELTSKELDCEEFHSILRGVLAPKATAGATAGGATYNRSEMNMNRAIHFCMMKADFSADGTINFREFKSFMLYLRRAQKKNTADMIFALFDLDGNEEITEKEFREIYRFYLGHMPTEDEFQEEWGRLDRKGVQKVTRKDYIRWLRTSPNPLFRQHAPPKEEGEQSASKPKENSMTSTGAASLPDLQRSRRVISGSPKKPSWDRRVPAPGLVPPWSTDSMVGRPKWNQRFNAGVNMNPFKPRAERMYFSRPQSLPELKRYYETHNGFQRHIAGLTKAQQTMPSPRDDPATFVF
jgi:hypothetical protein